MSIELDNLEQIVIDLKANGEVKIKGIGKFIIRSVKARKARNPQTGASVDVPAHKKIAFRVAKQFKDSVL